jgi:hypothetical protein
MEPCNPNMAGCVQPWAAAQKNQRIVRQPQFTRPARGLSLIRGGDPCSTQLCWLWRRC